MQATLPLYRWTILIALMMGLVSVAHGQIISLPHEASPEDAFGVDVAFNGEYAVVGASGEDECGSNSGAAYVFEQDPDTNQWSKSDRLTPSICEEGAFFGRTLDVSGDRIVVGASSEFFADRRPSAAYVFEYDPNSEEWEETARLEPDMAREEGSFASSVSIDDDRILVTSSGSMHGEFGGAAYVYHFDPSTGEWAQADRLTASDGTTYGVLGGNGDIEGDILAASAPTYFEQEPGSIYIFEWDGDSWNETARLDDFDDFYIKVELHERRLLVGESRARSDDSGEVSLHERDAAGNWFRTATIRPTTPYENGAFGGAVSIDGTRIMATGYDEQLGLDYNIDRVAYVFRNNPDEGWSEQQVVDIGEVDFGTAIDHHDDVALISSVPDDEGGRAYVVGLF